MLVIKLCARWIATSFALNCIPYINGGNGCEFTFFPVSFRVHSAAERSEAITKVIMAIVMAADSSVHFNRVWIKILLCAKCSWGESKKNWKSRNCPRRSRRSVFFLNHRLFSRVMHCRYYTANFRPLCRRNYALSLPQRLCEWMKSFRNWYWSIKWFEMEIYMSLFGILCKLN